MNLNGVFSKIKSQFKRLEYKIRTDKIKKALSPAVTYAKLYCEKEDIVRSFDSALHNVTDTNTVYCDFKVYNSTGLLSHPLMIRAGKNYHTPWTRDAAINTWQAMRFLSPEVARTTLFAVCSLNESGEPVIQPDVQVWDQIVWTVGAWNYYLATGDEEFLSVARGIIKRALDCHRRNRFNKDFQLFRGGSFFNDGIAGYPIECHDPKLHDSFAPAHSVVEKIMCLSTNCLFCEAYRIYSEISAHFGDEKEAETALTYHNELKDTINRIFFNSEAGLYRYILYPDGHTDDSQELAGHVFAILFDICPEEKQKALLESLMVSERGTVSVWPPFEGLFSDDKPGRHNNVIWPFLNGMLIEAYSKCGLHSLAGKELGNITELYKGSNFRLDEIYSPYTGKAYGGWQIGREWDSCRDQTWSATCYLGAFINGIFGISAEETGIRFSPCVPEILEGAELKLTVRGMKLTVKINGYGSEIECLTIDGKESDAFLPYDNNEHQLEIYMQ